MSSHNDDAYSDDENDRSTCRYNPTRSPTFSGMPQCVTKTLAEYGYWSAPYPNETVAEAGALTMIASIIGCSHSIDGMGPNLYVIVSGETGIGKEAAADAGARILTAMSKDIPAIAETRGPGQFPSWQGVHRELASRTYPSMRCIIGEIGLKFTQWTSPRRDANNAGIEAGLLHVYSKSGPGHTLDNASYSDPRNNPGLVHSPALTILGDTTPDTIKTALNASPILSGLVSRFMFFETKEKRPYINKRRVIEPPSKLISDLKDLAAVALSTVQSGKFFEIRKEDEAIAKFDEFERWTVSDVFRPRCSMA